MPYFITIVWVVIVLLVLRGFRARTARSQIRRRPGQQQGFDPTGIDPLNTLQDDTARTARAERGSSHGSGHHKSHGGVSGSDHSGTGHHSGGSQHSGGGHHIGGGGGASGGGDLGGGHHH
jgi:hypothetical protein